MTAHAVLTEAARKVAEGEELNSCSAIEPNQRVLQFYNSFAPQHTFTWNQFLIGDFGYLFDEKQQTHRVLMLLFAAEFARSEGVDW